MNKYSIFLFILVILPSFHTLNAARRGGRGGGFHGRGGFHGGRGGRGFHGGRGFGRRRGYGYGVGFSVGFGYPRRSRLYHYDDYDYYNNRSCRNEIRNLEQENRQLINDYNKLANNVRMLEQDASECARPGTSARKTRTYQSSYSITRRSYGGGYYCRDTLEQLDHENNKLVEDYNNLSQYAQELEQELNECQKETK